MMTGPAAGDTRPNRTSTQEQRTRGTKMANTSKCEKCNKIIPVKHTLTCTHCHKTYHQSCTKISEKLFDLIKQKKSHNWKCEMCINKLRETNRSKPSIPIAPKSTSTPQAQDFVTHRKKDIINIPVENSFQSLSSQDSDDDESSIVISTSLNRSCPEIGINTTETIDELKWKITELQNKLQIADNEIDNLLIENGTLKKQIRYFEKKTDRLSSICQSTPRRKSNRKEQKSRNMSSLDLTSLEQTNNKQDSEAVNKIGEIPKLNISDELKSKTPINKSLSNENVGPTSAPLRSTIECNNDMKRKVLIFSDQNGKGIRNTLQNMLGKDFQVTAIIKPNVHVNQILSSCNTICKDFTDADCVIVLAGANDRNPCRFQSYIYFYLSLLTNTNVLVGEIYDNTTLNVYKQNEVLRLACSQFPNTNFIPLTYDYLPQYHKLNTCRLILKEILAIAYKFNYVKHIEKCRKEINTKKDPIKKGTKFQSTIPYLFNRMKQNNAQNKETPKVTTQNNEQFFRNQK